MDDNNADRWSRISATLGAAAWALLATLAARGRAPLGSIELLFLFAPLVIVPLGIRLGRIMAPGRPAWLDGVILMIQPFAAGLAVASFWRPPGAVAGALVSPWAMVCGLIALQGLAGFIGRAPRSLATMAINVGRIDLAVAGGWLGVSRLGVHLGFQEPIVLLTAVHFHYTGFAAALLSATALGFARRRGHKARLLAWLVALVVFVPFVVAAGFVFSPPLKVVAVVVLSVSLAGVALCTLRLSKELESGTARGFIRISSTAVLGGMALATIYGIGDALGKDWLLIPRMARTHGLLNGLGFVLLGLLGWLVERSALQRDSQSRPDVSLQDINMNVLASEKLTT
jgi:YndJ-like protein